MRYMTEICSYQSKKKAAVTLGKFEGLHRGHQKLIDQVREYASEDVESIVCAFDMGKASLLTAREKREKLEYQVDTMIACPFTKELREMEAEEFIRQILAERFHAAYIVVGTDFHFGHEKRGDVDMLAKYAKTYGYHLDVVEKERYGSRVISSTYVREALDEGNVELANNLLGYMYQISGMVEHGKQLGRTLGFPTMNVPIEPHKVLPRFGVYACQIEVEGQCYPGIGNIGVKPTVAEGARALVEAFAFDFDGEVYGKEVTVKFLAFERPEQKFGSVEELKAQVDKDILFGREYFIESPNFAQRKC